MLDGLPRSSYSIQLCLVLHTTWLYALIMIIRRVKLHNCAYISTPAEKNLSNLLQLPQLWPSCSGLIALVPGTRPLLYGNCLDIWESLDSSSCNVGSLIHSDQDLLIMVIEPSYSIQSRICLLWWLEQICQTLSFSPNKPFIRRALQCWDIFNSASTLYGQVITWSWSYLGQNEWSSSMGWWVGWISGSPTFNFQIAWCFLASHRVYKQHWGLFLQQSQGLSWFLCYTEEIVTDTLCTNLHSAEYILPQLKKGNCRSNDIIIKISLQKWNIRVQVRSGLNV